MGPRLEARVRERGDVRLLRIDIVQWGSPVADQYDIHRLPTVWMYQGRKLLSDDPREIADLLRQN